MLSVHLSVRQSRFRVWATSPTSQRLVLGTIGLLDSVPPSVRQSVTLSCLGHISYIICGRNPKFDVWMHLGMAECRVSFIGH